MSTPTAAHGALPEAGELLPCPFCGSSDIRKADNGGDGYGPDSFWLVCNSCSAEGPYGQEDKIAEAWNDRAALSPASSAPGVSAWQNLNDREWNNIVNSRLVLDADDRDEAVSQCFKLTEAKLRQKNAATPAQQTQSAAVAGAVAEVVMSAAPVGVSPAWKPHKIIYASLAWLDSVPVGTKLYATPPQQATPSAAASVKPDVQGEAQKLSDAQVDRMLSAHINGGSQASHWFLPHESERGLANVRDVVRAMVAALKEAPGGGQ